MKRIDLKILIWIPNDTSIVHVSYLEHYGCRVFKEHLVISEFERSSRDTQKTTRK